MIYVVLTLTLTVFMMLILYLKKSLNVDSFFEEGVIFFNNKEYKKAIEAFSKVIEIEPLNIKAYLYLATCFDILNNISSAEAIYNKLIRISNPENVSNKVVVFKKMAELYKKNRLFDKAFLEYLKILELDESEVEAHFNLGHFYAGQGKISESINYFKTALKIDDDFIEARLYLALCYAIKNWYSEAEKELEKILKTHPNNTKAKLFLGYIQKDNKDPAAITTFMEIAKEEDENLKYKAIHLMGLTSIEQSFYDQAISNYKKILEEDKNIPNKWFKEYKYNLGWAYLFKGNISQAMNEWNDLANIDINFYNIADLIKNFDDLNLKDMEEEWYIYSMNETIPNIEAYIGHPKKYDISALLEEFENWKKENQELLNIKFVKGIIRSPEKLANANISDFKKMSRKIIKHLNLLIEKEEIKSRGINYIAVIKNEKKDRIIVWIKNWQDTIGEAPVYKMIEEMKKGNYKLGIFIICGKFTKKAKDLAKKHKIKLYGKKALSNLLLEL